METYESQNFKIPQESSDYKTCSDFVINSIEGIVEEAIETGRNKIILNTNLKMVCLWRILTKLQDQLLRLGQANC